MDPNTCMNDMVDALHQEDRSDAADSAAEFLEWCERGGFLPTAHATSWIDTVAREYHISADEWSADDLGEESVSLTRLTREDVTILRAALVADGVLSAADAYRPAYLLVLLDRRGFVWPETIGTSDPATETATRREALERYEEECSDFGWMGRRRIDHR